jgi:hypothetical protein
MAQPRHDARIRDFSIRELLDTWLPAVLSIANDPEAIVLSEHPGEGDWALALQTIVDGGPVKAVARALGCEGTARWLPLVGVRVEHGRVRTVYEQTADIALHDANTLDAIIIALAADPLARRLRRCDQCRAFFLANANHRRDHSFCSDTHRRLFDVAHRDPDRMAAYMREYRKTVQRLKKKATTKRTRR